MAQPSLLAEDIERYFSATGQYLPDRERGTASDEAGA